MTEHSNSRSATAADPRGVALSTQLSILLICLALLTFAATVLVSTSNMRNYLDSQLAQTAQDTANSLGLAISPYVGNDDMTVADTMVSAIFDSGAYLQIRFVDQKKQPLLERQNELKVDGVPVWFLALFPLEPPVMQSEVNDGWRIAGALSVQAHPGYAFKSLWQHTKAVFWTSLLICLLALGAVHVLLWYVLKPLKDIEKLAQHLAEKRFELLNYMPLTKELRAVVRALNHMVSNVKRNFSEMTDRAEQLNQQVYLDPLTGLPNRRALLQSFSSLPQTPAADANRPYLTLIALTSLKQVNDQQGYAAGDQYVEKAAGLLQQQARTQELAQVFRISGSEFAILTQFGEGSASTFQLQLQQTFEIANSEQYPHGFAAVVMAPLQGAEELSSVLARLDGLQARQLNHPAPATQNPAEALINPLSRSHWQEILHEFTRSVVSDTTAGFSDTSLQISNEMAAMFNLEVQPVFQGTQVLYAETFVRFNARGEQLASADVFAMAERLGVSLLLDKALVTYILSQLRGQSSHSFAINLSKSALHDSQFTRWLVNTLEANRAWLPKLVFEVNEQATLGAIASANQFFGALKQAGAAITIERFGASFSSFRYLQGLNIDFIKIDGSYIHALESPDTRFFVETMTQICHGIGIRVIAAQVELRSQAEICQQLHVDALQGRALHAPVSFLQIAEKNDCKFSDNQLSSN
ncbi:EAL domain-containing protein [Rheinheimera sp. F8]|uniref:bifunctional diguanylate cyclase/phosphodiesterase n=1 Tax=Rheinheimera sp. F8 TaxID=1763998 RepID=UPI000744A3C1|nr:EAL domain-containing protein [Rheinheimera sp. F8]ALZ77069.1 hypothetical protein ATY27_15760 [Rheinheimera sp. F8]